MGMGGGGRERLRKAEAGDAHSGRPGDEREESCKRKGCISWWPTHGEVSR